MGYSFWILHNNGLPDLVLQKSFVSVHSTVSGNRAWQSASFNVPLPTCVTYTGVFVPRILLASDQWAVARANRRIYCKVWRYMISRKYYFNIPGRAWWRSTKSPFVQYITLSEIQQASRISYPAVYPGFANTISKFGRFTNSRFLAFAIVVPTVSAVGHLCGLTKEVFAPEVPGLRGKAFPAIRLS